MRVEVSGVTTNLSELVPSFKRELAVPGTFDAVFPDTTDEDLTGALADGFAEAQLYGFFKNTALTEDDDDWVADPELSAAGGALVVIYASIRTIRAQLRALKTHLKYVAGPVEYEADQAASVLTQELKYLQQRLDDIIDHATGAARASAGIASVFDNYLARTAVMSTWGGFYPHEWK